MKSSLIFVFLLNIGFVAAQMEIATDTLKVTPDELRNKIKQSNFDNNLVYTYTDWCAPCVKEFPRVLEFCSTNKIGLFIIVMSKEGNANLEKLHHKLKKKYNFNGRKMYNFVYDVKYLHNVQKSNYRNYQAFIAEFLDRDFDPEIIYGSNCIILTDENSAIKLVSAVGTYDEIFERLKTNLQ